MLERFIPTCLLGTSFGFRDTHPELSDIVLEEIVHSQPLHASHMPMCCPIHYSREVCGSDLESRSILLHHWVDDRLLIA